MMHGKSDKGDIPSPFRAFSGLHLTDEENEASDFGQRPQLSNSSGANFVSPPHVSLLDSPLKNVHGTFQSYTQAPAYTQAPVLCGNKTDFMRPRALQNSQIGHQFIDYQSGLRNQDICETGYPNPLVNVNSFPDVFTTGGYQMNGWGELSRGNNENWLLNSATSGSLISNITSETVPSNDIKFNALPPGNVDGSFLTLGLGVDVESRSRSRFSSREVAGSLSPQISQPYTTNFSNMSQNSTGGFFGVQSNPGVLPGSLHNRGGWTRSLPLDFHTFGLEHISNPLHSNLQAAPMPYDFLGNFSFANAPGISPATHISAGYHGFPAPDVLPFSFDTHSSCYGFTKPSELASESDKSTWTSAPPAIYYPQNSDRGRHRDTLSSISQRGNYVAPDHLGMLIPPTEDFSSRAVPASLCFQSSAHAPTMLEVNPARQLGNITSPEKFGLQIAKGAAFASGTADSLPMRGGVNIGDDFAPQSHNDTVLARAPGFQTRNNFLQAQTYGPVQLNRNFLRPTPADPHQDSLQLPPGIPRPSSTGQGLPGVRPSMPAQTSYATKPASLKRRAVAPPSIPSWGQRRKLVHVPHRSSINEMQGTAAFLPPPAPPVAAYIKGPVIEESPRTTGWKCLLCKKDLSFSPDNHVHQPTVPPPVAVLPCGHTFHDQCLHLITPEDQAKDPPCIPCAIGEN